MPSNLFRVSIGLLILGAILSGSLRAQVTNDTCATAIAVANGNTLGANSGASIGPDPIPGCGSWGNDVWFSYIAPCTGAATASLCPPGSANFDTVMGAWIGACGCLSEVACNDDSCSLSSRVTFAVVAGTTYYISIGGFDGEVGSFALNMSCAALNPPPLANLTLTINAGVGTLGYDLTGGFPNGIGFTGITTTLGGFPSGPFFGIEMTFLEVLNEIAVGFPFLTNLSPCGSVSAGPYFGLPPGFTVYGVSLAAPTGSQTPSAVSAPVSATVL